MSEDLKSPVDSQADEPVVQSQESVQQVSYDTHKKLLSEKKRLQAERDQLRAEREAAELAKLEADGKLNEQVDFYKSKHTEALSQVEELTQKLTGEQEKWNAARKLSAFKEALPGTITNSKHLSHVPLDEILLDPESGSPDPASLKRVVDAFQKEFPEVITSGRPPKSPNEFPGGSSASTAAPTPEEFAKMSYEEKQKHKKAMLEAMRQH